VSVEDVNCRELHPVKRLPVPLGVGERLRQGSLSQPGLQVAPQPLVQIILAGQHIVG